MGRTARGGIRTGGVPGGMKGRHSGIDQLRFLLMMMGIALHTLCAYLTSFKIPEFPVFDGTAQFWLWDGLVLWIHAFRMPLFFTISGFVSLRGLQNESRSEFLKKRWSRLMIPFLVSYLLLLPILRWEFGIFQSLEDQNLFEMSFLWFLYVLFLINGVGLLFRRPLLHLVEAWCRTHWLGGMAIFYFLTTAALSTFDLGILKTDDGWFQDPFLFFFYSAYFVLGLAIAARGTTGLLRSGVSRAVGIASLILGVAYCLCVQQAFLGDSRFVLVATFLHGLVTLFTALWVFQLFLNRSVDDPSRTTALAQSTYTMYLIHPLWVVAWVAWLGPFLQEAPVVKPILVFFFASLASYAVYAIAVRPTFLNRYL